MLDAKPARLVKWGRLVIEELEDGSVVMQGHGFAGEGTSTERDVAVLVACWAIQQISRELQALLQAPVGGLMVVH